MPLRHVPNDLRVKLKAPVVYVEDFEVNLKDVGSAVKKSMIYQTLKVRYTVCEPWCGMMLVPYAGVPIST